MDLSKAIYHVVSDDCSCLSLFVFVFGCGLLQCVIMTRDSGGAQAPPPPYFSATGLDRARIKQKSEEQLEVKLQQ